MSQPTPVYDLGELDLSERQARTASSGTAVHRTVTPAASPVAGAAGFDLSGTLSLLLPGTGHLVRGDVATGLFVLSSMGFLVAVGWALLETLGRVIETLRILGYPGAPAVWTIGALYALAAVLHVGSIVTAPGGRGGTPHPAVAGLASAMLPGWGQVLNGARTRAALFVGSLWVVVAMWFLESPAVIAQLDGLGLFLPDVVHTVCAPAVRWTAPAVIWALAVYDAIASAASRR